MILVSGLINIETTVKIDRFPLEYFPVRYAFDGVRSTVSGVGWNVAKALTVIGSDVRFGSMIGRDASGRLVRDELSHQRIDGRYVSDLLDETPQSAILYDENGRRQIHVDLKRTQETTLPDETADALLDGVDTAVLCNIGFSRPLLARARERKIQIATDLHAIGSLDDEYNRDWLEAADVVFASDERLPCEPTQWILSLFDRFRASIAVVGLGARGAMLGIRQTRSVTHVPAVVTRPIVNTIGAGDALFSAFVHFWHTKLPPVAALRRAVLFASWKIGERGAADGFVSEAALTKLAREKGIAFDA